MDKIIKSRRKIPKLKPIARKRHNYFYLLLGILLTISTLYIFYNFSPNYKFSISNFEISIIPIFLISLALCIFAILTFIFRKKTQGLIVSFLVIIYFILRLLGLTHWIFGSLILIIFITVELFILKKK